MRLTLYGSLRQQPSMERYARALAAELPGLAPFLQVTRVPPEGFPARPFHWRKYVSYQRAARGWAGEVNHVIDHGYAHLVGALPARSTVVTVHDMGPLWPGRKAFAGREGGWRASRAYAYSLRAMRGAARIVAVSDSARRDLLDRTGWPEDRVEVIRSGVEERFAPVEEPGPVLDRFGLGGRRYLLHVGSSTARKNLEVIVRALPLIEPEVWLVKAGAPLEPPERKLAAGLGVLHRIAEIGEPDDDRLPALYTAAECLVFPSLYEGFGWPPLEAMACGTPAVVSAIPALLETSGPGALVIEDPRSAEELAGAIARGLRGSAGRDGLVAAGRARAAEFDWKITAGKYLALYAQVAEGRAR
jgi:glycosyltransferase involved in cell wall biosynthesis